MKKNTKNRKNLVAVVMVLLLAVVLFMSGSTYAKYITQKDVATEQATVAKWGYVITFNTDEFFGSDYTKVAEGNIAKVSSETGESVAAVGTQTRAQVVAPGTSGKMTLLIAGQAEVLSKITFTVTGKNAANNAQAIKLTNNGTETVNYEPIKWTVSNSGTTVLENLPSNATLAELEQWLENLNNNFASVNPNTKIDINLEISWTWDLNENDAYDTMLGDIAADKYTMYEAGKLPVGETEMYLNVNVKVEQIQNAVQQNQGQ